MRYPGISPDLFIRNRKKLAGLMEKDSVAIIHSNDQMVRSGDQFYPYRQNSDLFYMSGIEQEMSVIMLCPGQKEKRKKVMLFLREPDPKLETWEGKKLDLEEAGKISGIGGIHWLDDFKTISRSIILQSSNIYCNIPEHEKFKPEYPSRDERMMAELKKDYPSHEFKRMAPLMMELRMVKEPEELELIRQAIDITRAGLDRVLGFVRPGLHEYQVEAELTHEFIRRGAGGHAYPPIIASGGNACMLHYIKNDQTCKKGDLLLMDFGAEYANYAADCTRTIPVGGRFSERQRKLYDATLRVFRGARSLMEPGTTIDKINELVGKLWEEEHLKLGLYTSSELRNQSEDNPLYKRYFMHGTAHFMGLDVHDTGSKQAELKPGMVLTCEPGIYIPEEKTGIRLENDILITGDGNADLMYDFPIEAEEIEEIMNRERKNQIN
jgi:Xaa-Pro aminopeptidase